MIIAARIIKTLVDKTMTSLRSKEIGRGGLMECHVNKNFDFVQVYNRHKNVVILSKVASEISRLDTSRFFTSLPLLCVNREANREHTREFTDKKHCYYFD
jgi:hypothetical protein